jgi:hypothetical protein
MAKGIKTGGRRKGPKNKVALAKAAALAASGLMPLDYMLGVLRNPLASTEDKRWAAEKAAPYCHPKLTATELGGTVTISQEDALAALE